MTDNGAVNRRTEWTGTSSAGVIDSFIASNREDVRKLFAFFDDDAAAEKLRELRERFWGKDAVDG